MCFILCRMRLQKTIARSFLRPGFIASFVPLFFSSAIALENGMALTPPMGWNTFNTYKSGWDDNTIKTVADSFVSTGLKDCGYEYVIADGHWSGTTPYWPGTPGFVAWAAPLAEYVHDKGLKFGVYMFTTDDPEQTAADLVAAGIDYLKHDQFLDNMNDPTFAAMRDALVAAGTPAVYSIHSSSHVLAPEIANMCRTGDDIIASWDAIMRNYDMNYVGSGQAGPGAWADPDMLETGCPYVNPDGSNDGWMLTPDEMRAHFSMWCMMAAPLIMGFDVARTGPAPLPVDKYAEVMAIHTNTELIAIDQDSLGSAGRRVKGQGGREVWIKDLKSGMKAVALFNRLDAAGDMSISKEELGWQSEAMVYARDLWTHQSTDPFDATFTKNVAPHAAEIYLMSREPMDTRIAVLNKMEKADAWLRHNGHTGVLPRSTLLKVMQGNTGSLHMFDMQGRFIAADPRLVGPHAFIMRDFSNPSMTAKIVWPGK